MPIVSLWRMGENKGVGSFCLRSHFPARALFVSLPCLHLFLHPAVSFRPLPVSFTALIAARLSALGCLARGSWLPSCFLMGSPIPAWTRKGDRPTFLGEAKRARDHLAARGGLSFLQYTRTFPLLGACADISTEPKIPPLGVWPMRYSRFVRRIAVIGEASVRSCATEDSEDGTLLDVSRKGARFCINRLFRPGLKLTLMMNLPWDEPPVEVRLATVKWVHQDTVGVEFSESKTTIESCSTSFSPLDLNHQRRRDKGARPHFAALGGPI